MKTLRIFPLTAIVILGLSLVAPSTLTSGYSGSVALPFGVLTYGDGDMSLAPLLGRYYNDPKDYVLNPNYYESFPQQRKVIGGESLSELRDVIDKAGRLSYTIDSVAYDIEHWNFTPATEQNNVPLAVHNASVIAHSAGYRFIVTPDMTYLLENYEEINWMEVDVLVIQGQNVASDTNMFSEMAWNVSSYVRPINPEIEIFAEVSLSRTDANQTISAIGSVKSFIDGIVVVYRQNGDGTCQYCTENNLDKVLTFITTPTASPVAIAGPDRVAPDESSVTIDGAASFDPDGGPLIYSWSQVSGYTVNLTDTKSAKLQIHTPKLQSDKQLAFRLVVTDASGASATDEVSMTVKNLGPYDSNLAIGLAQKTIPWGKNVTITGKLVDLELTKTGIPDRVISINGTGILGNNAVYAVTGADGKFTVSFPAPNVVGTGWKVKAYFSGDSTYLQATSTVGSFDTVKHKTISTISTSSTSLPWGRPISFLAALKDVDTGLTLSGMTMRFDGSAQARISYVATNASGVATLATNAPNSIQIGWTVQAHFSGNTNYLSSDSTVQTFDTTKHETRLSLMLYPSEILAGKTFTVSVKLTDKVTGEALSSRSIAFSTGTQLLSISDLLTDSNGSCTMKGLVASSVGSYSIQANFRGDALYGISSSPSRVLTVK